MQGIQVMEGHRLRDLTAALSVIVLGTAMAMAALAGEGSTALLVPAVVFACGCGAIVIAYSFGFIVDKLAEHMPALSRPRECPRIHLRFQQERTDGGQFRIDVLHARP